MKTDSVHMMSSQRQGEQADIKFTIIQDCFQFNISKFTFIGGLIHYFIAVAGLINEI